MTRLTSVHVTSCDHRRRMEEKAYTLRMDVVYDADGIMPAGRKALHIHEADGMLYCAVEAGRQHLAAHLDVYEGFFFRNGVPFVRHPETEQGRQK